MEAIDISSAPESQLNTRSLPWVPFFFLIVVLFIAFHNPYPSLKDMEYGALHASYEEQVSEQDRVTQAIYQGSLRRQVGFLMLGLFGVFGLLRKYRGALFIKDSLGIIILLFLIWSFLSCSWTDDLAMTFRRLGILTLSCLGALAFATRFSLRDTVFFAFLSTAIFLFIGLLAEISLRTFSPWVADFQFAGTLHPNNQGINCSIMLLSAAFLARTSEGRSRFVFLMAMVVAFIFLYFTKSRTAMASTLIAIMVSWTLGFSLSRRLSFLIYLTLAFALFMALFGESLIPTIWHGILLGRDPSTASTLTGRTLVWQLCMDFVAKQPLIGYGYGAFWNPDRAYLLMSQTDWNVSSAHSAYIDLMLSVGLIGMVLYVLILCLGIKRCFSYYKVTGNSNYIFLGCILIYCFVNGFMESLTISVTFITILMFVALVRLTFLIPTININDIWLQSAENDKHLAG